MTLGELQAWVLRTLKRPELSVQALDAINAAIEYACANGDYAFDLVEGSWPANPLIYAQSIPIAATFPRFRKIKYLRPVGYSRYLTWRDPSRIFDADGCEATNCYYRAGDNIVTKVSQLSSSFLYGYYTYPAAFTLIGGTNNYTDQMSAAIHDLAAARVWDDNGNDAESQRLERRALRMLMLHKADKQDGVSHS